MPGPVWGEFSSMGEKPEMDDSAAAEARKPEKLNHGHSARKKDEIVNTHDTRSAQENRRCQRDNVLMEPVGVVGRTSAYHCETCSTIQIRAI